MSNVMKIIGICGPSCSGKSSIAKELAKELNCDVLHVDDFYDETHPKIYVDHDGEQVRSFESPKLFDLDMVATILDQLHQNGTASAVKWVDNFDSKQEHTWTAGEYLVVEHFFLYTHPELLEKIDYPYFIDVPDGVILQRREARGGRPRADELFKKIGLREWHKLGAAQKDLAGISVLDGRLPVEENVEKIIKDI